MSISSNGMKRAMHLVCFIILSNNKYIDIAALDEPFGSLDSNRIFTLVHSMRSLLQQRKIKNLIIATHNVSVNKMLLENGLSFTVKQKNFICAKNTLMQIQPSHIFWQIDYILHTWKNKDELRIILNNDKYTFIYFSNKNLKEIEEYILKNNKNLNSIYLNLIPSIKTIQIILSKSIQEEIHNKLKDFVTSGSESIPYNININFLL